MAKDDYEVIVYKILVYLYGCLKRVTVFSEAGFNHAVGCTELNEGYLIDIIRLMKNDGLIENARFQKTWGNEYVMISELRDISITSAGIRYLGDMKEQKKETIKNTIIQTASPIISLIELLKL